jgi:hypothetical protein
MRRPDLPAISHLLAVSDAWQGMVNLVKLKTRGERQYTSLLLSR